MNEWLVKFDIEDYMGEDRPTVDVDGENGIISEKTQGSGASSSQCRIRWIGINQLYPGGCLC